MFLDDKLKTFSAYLDDHIVFSSAGHGGEWKFN